MFNFFMIALLIEEPFPINDNNHEEEPQIEDGNEKYGNEISDDDEFSDSVDGQVCCFTIFF